MIRWPSLNFAVVMGTATSRQKSQASQRTQSVGEGIGETLLEPADRAGAHAGEDDPRLPRLAQDFFHPPIFPDGNQALGVAAADINHVLIEQERTQIRRALEKSQNRRTATQLQNRRAEARKITSRLAARGRHERHARAIDASLPEHVLFQFEILRIAVKPATADRNDLLDLARHGSGL